MEFQSNNLALSTIFPNPENPLEIKIPLFEGPLDLLLHLIRKKEVSIAEVRLSELTASYLEYLEQLQSINLDLAGEFLEIAAMLILIKSRSLLPKSPVEIEDLEEEDPEEEDTYSIHCELRSDEEFDDGVAPIEWLENRFESWIEVLEDDYKK